MFRKTPEISPLNCLFFQELELSCWVSHLQPSRSMARTKVFASAGGGLSGIQPIQTGEDWYGIPWRHEKKTISFRLQDTLMEVTVVDVDHQECIAHYGPLMGSWLSKSELQFIGDMWVEHPVPPWPQELEACPQFLFSRFGWPVDSWCSWIKNQIVVQVSLFLRSPEIRNATSYESNVFD